jgi:hypothetical protein
VGHRAKRDPLSSKPPHKSMTNYEPEGHRRAKKPPRNRNRSATALIYRLLLTEAPKLKSPKTPAKSHVKPQGPKNPHHKIHNRSKMNYLQPKN